MKPGLYGIGEFEITSGKAILTDPCYKRGTRCQGVIDNVRSGVWRAKVDVEIEHYGWGPCVRELLAYHTKSSRAHRGWEGCNFGVGVDSGQAGIFDDAKYPDEPGRYIDKDSFYRRACELTAGDDRYGILPFGVVSSSGFGDGEYQAYVARDTDGQVIGIRIIFIDDPEESD